jgi:Sec-independent protein secretion pathway component TatC
VGVSFETPLIMAFLARLGIITPQMLIPLLALCPGRHCRHCPMAAAITATVDPLNMVLVMLPLAALYGLGILLAFLAYRERKRPFDEEADETTSG